MLSATCEGFYTYLGMGSQWGWFGLAPHPISGARVVAIGLLLGAVTLTQLDRKALTPDSRSVSSCDR